MLNLSPTLALPLKSLMEAHKVSLDVIFAKYTRLPKDRRCFLLDVRPEKQFKRRHLFLSYCIRLAKTGNALLDYSKNAYDIRWSQVSRIDGRTLASDRVQGALEECSCAPLVHSSYWHIRRLHGQA